MGADDLIDLLTLQNPEGDNGENLTNQLAAVDLRLTLPFLRKGRVLGHAAGGDSQEFFWRLTRDLTKQATAGVDFSYQRRGDTILSLDPTAKKERHFRGGIDLRYFFTDSWEFHSRFAMEKVENVNLQQDRDRTNILFLLQLRCHFFGQLT